MDMFSKNNEHTPVPATHNHEDIEKRIQTIAYNLWKNNKIHKLNDDYYWEIAKKEFYSNWHQS